MELTNITTESIINFSKYLLFALGILIICIVLTKLILRIIESQSINRRIKFLNRKTVEVDVTRHQFLKHALPTIIFITGVGLIIYLIPPLNALSSSWLAGAGILALVIGFAAQQAMANIVAGIFIIMFKPFRVGDWITINEDTGIVEDINLRQTQIVDFNNRRIIIPNSIISNETIVNADISDKRVCEYLDFKISFESNIDLAKKIITEEATKHKLFHDRRTETQKKEGMAPVYIYVREIGEYYVLLRAMVWSKDAYSGWYMRVDLLESIKKKFEKKGIEIPYPANVWFQKKKKNAKK